MEGLGDLGVMPHPVAVAPDVDDVTAMHEAVDQRTGHVIAGDTAPVLEGSVRGEQGRGVLTVLDVGE